ncbi:hypothetical protein [Ruegeria profundi]|uniref:hypothetical protein n=1 Tax=Ruegeria profundi TaxID=1685378 RepID=UPI001CD72C83|nr:hypothetical protein [Ruegeria profundi]MCA0928829.1 hypothetical protein [Ruegeria profundi]
MTRYRREQGLSTASYGAIATPLNGMQLYFLGATAGHFQTSVTGVETDSPLNLGNLYVVTGRVKNQPARAFRCQFDAQGHFTGVFQ